MHKNHRRGIRRGHRMYRRHRMAWFKRLYHHVYRQKVKEALRRGREPPSMDEIWDLWLFD